MNLEISSYGFEVRQISFRDETYVGFVNKEADSCSAKATGYRKDGKPNGAYTSFFGALLEAMAMSETATLSDQDAYYVPIRVAGGEGEVRRGERRRRKVRRGVLGVRAKRKRRWRCR